MLIIGSSALKHYYSDFPREPKDLDYAVVDEQQSILGNKEYKTVEYLKNPIILKYQKEGYPSRTAKDE